MLYEFIATMAAAFGLAGVALIITHLMKLAGKKAPKWLIPAFAAIGIFAFQIHQEYSWYDQQAKQLPQGVTVIKTIEKSVWYRPWSYIKPQIVRFIAADTAHMSTQVDDPSIHLVNLYLFERRVSVQKVPQVIDCAAPARADYVLPAATSQLTLDEHIRQTTQWQTLTTDDPIFTAVCVNSATARGHSHG